MVLRHLAQLLVTLTQIHMAGLRVSWGGGMPGGERTGWGSVLLGEVGGGWGMSWGHLEGCAYTAGAQASFPRRAQSHERSVCRLGRCGIAAACLHARCVRPARIASRAPPLPPAARCPPPAGTGSGRWQVPAACGPSVAHGAQLHRPTAQRPAELGASALLAPPEPRAPLPGHAALRG